jgi:glycosyltransferase involved in cell wall biosynthesis
VVSSVSYVTEELAVTAGPWGMSTSETLHSAQDEPELRAGQTRASIVVGVTHPQTCLVLGPRLRALRKAGFKVTLVAGPGELLELTAAREGVEAVAVPMKRGLAPLADLLSLVRLWLLLGRLKPDLVEFSTPKAGLLGSFAALLRVAPRRVYLLRGLRLETETGFKLKAMLIAEQISAACAHVVLCNSVSLRKKALELGVARPAKLKVLGDGSSIGVDTRRFSPGPSSVRAQLGLGTGTQVVGFVGRLTRDKGVPELIEAFHTILAAAPTAFLLLVGWFDESEDALGADLRARIQNHPRVHMTGYVRDTAPYYRAMDLMVLPTWREGFPNAVLEAAATGIPVVTTLSTGSRDAVLPEVTGLLIPPGYPEAISEAVLKLLCDPERSRGMGRSARAWVEQHYSETRVLGFTTAYYESLLRPDSDMQPISEIYEG